jgi:hypothetical protein
MRGFLSDSLPRPCLPLPLLLSTFPCSPSVLRLYVFDEKEDELVPPRRAMGTLRSEFSGTWGGAGGDGFAVVKQNLSSVSPSQTQQRPSRLLGSSPSRPRGSASEAASRVASFLTFDDHRSHVAAPSRRYRRHGHLHTSSPHGHICSMPSGALPQGSSGAQRGAAELVSNVASPQNREQTEITLNDVLKRSFVRLWTPLGRSVMPYCRHTPVLGTLTLRQVDARQRHVPRLPLPWSRSG